MAEMKLSNNAVTTYARQRIKSIQCRRGEYERESENYIISRFSSYNSKWVYSRDFWDWFKYFGPFALMGLLFYPISILMRHSVIKSAPKTDNTYVLATWLDRQSDWSTYRNILSSDAYEKEYETCLKLKCMAQINEEEYMTITQEEAVAIGIC